MSSSVSAAAGSGAGGSYRFADEFDDSLGVGEHDQVRGVDLADRHAGPAVAEPLDHVGDPTVLVTLLGLLDTVDHQFPMVTP